MREVIFTKVLVLLGVLPVNVLIVPPCSTTYHRESLPGACNNPSGLSKVSPVNRRKDISLPALGRSQATQVAFAGRSFRPEPDGVEGGSSLGDSARTTGAPLSQPCRIKMTETTSPLNTSL